MDHLFRAIEGTPQLEEERAGAGALPHEPAPVSASPLLHQLQPAPHMGEQPQRRPQQDDKEWASRVGQGTEQRGRRPPFSQTGVTVGPQPEQPQRSTPVTTPTTTPPAMHPPPTTTTTTGMTRMTTRMATPSPAATDSSIDTTTMASVRGMVLDCVTQRLEELGLFPSPALPGADTHTGGAPDRRPTQTGAESEAERGASGVPIPVPHHTHADNTVNVGGQSGIAGGMTAARVERGRGNDPPHATSGRQRRGVEEAVHVSLFVQRSPPPQRVVSSFSSFSSPPSSSSTIQTSSRRSRTRTPHHDNQRAYSPGNEMTDGERAPQNGPLVVSATTLLWEERCVLEQRMQAIDHWLHSARTPPPELVDSVDGEEQGPRDQREKQTQRTSQHLEEAVHTGKSSFPYAHAHPHAAGVSRWADNGSRLATGHNPPDNRESSHVAMDEGVTPLTGGAPPPQPPQPHCPHQRPPSLPRPSAHVYRDHEAEADRRGHPPPHPRPTGADPCLAIEWDAVSLDSPRQLACEEEGEGGQDTENKGNNPLATISVANTTMNPQGGGQHRGSYPASEEGRLPRRFSVPGGGAPEQQTRHYRHHRTAEVLWRHQPQQHQQRLQPSAAAAATAAAAAAAVYGGAPGRRRVSLTRRTSHSSGNHSHRPSHSSGSSPYTQRRRGQANVVKEAMDSADEPWILPTPLSTIPTNHTNDHSLTSASTVAGGDSVCGSPATTTNSSHNHSSSSSSSSSSSRETTAHLKSPMSSSQTRLVAEEERGEEEVKEGPKGKSRCATQPRHANPATTITTIVACPPWALSSPPSGDRRGMTDSAVPPGRQAVAGAVESSLPVTATRGGVSPPSAGARYARLERRFSPPLPRSLEREGVEWGDPALGPTSANTPTGASGRHVKHCPSSIASMSSRASLTLQPPPPSSAVGLVWAKNFVHPSSPSSRTSGATRTTTTGAATLPCAPTSPGSSPAQEKVKGREADDEDHQHQHINIGVPAPSRMDVVVHTRSPTTTPVALLEGSTTTATTTTTTTRAVRRLAETTAAAAVARQTRPPSTQVQPQRRLYFAANKRREEPRSTRIGDEGEPPRPSQDTTPALPYVNTTSPLVSVGIENDGVTRSSVVRSDMAYATGRKENTSGTTNSGRRKEMPSSARHHSAALSSSITSSAASP